MKQNKLLLSFLPLVISVIFALLTLAVEVFARPDVRIRPRNLESRINNVMAARDTLIVYNDGDEQLTYSLEVVYIDEVEEWLQVSRVEGAVNPGGNQRVVVVQHNRDLDPGSYLIQIIFETNDPTEPEVIVPVLGHTRNYPRIAVNWNQNMGEWWGVNMNYFIDPIVWGETYSFNLRISNTGSDELVIDELISNDGHWTIEPASFSLDPNSFRNVQFTFISYDVGGNATTITSSSNAWDERELYFRITADVIGVFRKGSSIPDLEMEEDSEELLIARLDTVFVSSDRAIEYQFSQTPGLSFRVARNTELFVQPHRNWNGSEEVQVWVTKDEETLSDTFRVTVHPVPDPPSPFDLMHPNDSDTIRWDMNESYFIWQSSDDPDGDDVNYSFILRWGDDSEQRWDDLSDTSFSFNALADIEDFSDGREFSWTVTASDGELERSAWSEFTNYIVSLSVKDDILPLQDFNIIDIYPNPFNSSLTIKLEFVKPNHFSVKVFDLNGRKVGEILTNKYSAGTHVISWQPEHIGSGVYLLKMQSDVETKFQKVIFIR